MDATCPLCSALERRDTLASNAHAVAIPDAYPVNPGHALVVSRRHVADLFDLSIDEQAGLWALVPHVKRALDERLRPTGYNVGINVGVSAGQTIGHVCKCRGRNDIEARNLAELARSEEWESHPEDTLGVARGLYLRLPAEARLWVSGPEFCPPDSSVLRDALG